MTNENNIEPLENDGSLEACDQNCSHTDPDGSQKTDELVPRSELLKVIRQRQSAKQRARELTGQLEKVLSENSPSPSDDGGVESVAGAEDIEDVKKLKIRLQRNTQKLSDLLRSQSLRSAAKAAGAVNPDQIVSILKDRVVMSENSQGDLEMKCLGKNGEILCDDSGNPAGADVLVAELLSSSANANLLLPSALPGSGARPTGAVPNDTAASLNSFNQMPPDKRRQAALTMTRAQREQLLGLGRSDSGAFL